jgi:amino acid adenylation domain-containing protein
MTVPASFAQQRLWFLDQLDPGAARYNVPVVLGLSGPLDLDALAGALDAVVARHDALRATFPSSGRGQVVEVAPEVRLRAPMDLLAGPDELPGAVERETLRPFDLVAGPLVRARILRLGVDEHVLALSLHHAVFDAWSEDVLFDELSQLYAAEALGAAPLRPLPVQYADYVASEREYLAGEEARRDLEHWRRRLAGAPGLLDLPTDREPVHWDPGRVGLRHWFLPARVWAGVRALSRERRTTPFSTLLAVFAALLSRYTGTTDVVVGTPVAGRARPEWEPLIGMFVNTLPLRVDLSGRPALAELVERVRTAVLEATEHQAIPFDRLVEAVGAQRAAGRNPLFQAMFSCAPEARRLPRLLGVRVRAIEAPASAAKFDLSLSVEPRRDGALARLEYAAGRFEAGTAMGLGRHYRRLLAGALASPDAPLAGLPLLGANERRLLVTDAASASLVPAQETSPPALFAAQTRRTPDALALRCGAEALTYRQLAGRVTSLAGTLVELGVGPEVRVGVALRRSSDLVAALLAVLEAGGVNVPIDPTYPPARIEHLLQDADVRLVLTDDLLAGLTLRPPGPVQPRAVGANLAYVVHTSGSTGRPKGVAVTRDGLASFLHGLREALPAGPGQLMAGLASVAFDGALEELFLPLVCGGCVVLYDDAVRRDPRELVRRLELDGVTVVHSTPSLLQALAARGWPGTPGLTVMSGGEPLSPALAATLRGRGANLWNVYGPTETTVVATAGPVDAGPVTIGRPLAGTSAHVLDAELEPVPPGVTGELCISGGNLARGYLGQPGATAERFVPDPLSPVPGGRLYRTGDLARRRADGRLEHLGRRDGQVKVRGIRVELGEVEAALLEQPGVAATAAAVRGPGQLVAYVVPVGDAEIDLTELRRALRSRLPDHLVPSLLVPLLELPLTPGGKVDRTALPAPDAAATPGEARIAPRTAAEDAIAVVWRTALGVPEVGVDDNFFDVGGHSLLMVVVQDELARRFDVDIPLTLLFQHPTIRSLATHFAVGPAVTQRLDRRRERGAARLAAAAGSARRRREGPA